MTSDAWIFDLVTERYINYADLKNGNLNLYDLVRISDAHSRNTENQIRIREYYEEHKHEK